MPDGNASEKRQEGTALEHLLALSVVVVTESVICSSGRMVLYA